MMIELLHAAAAEHGLTLVKEVPLTVCLPSRPDVMTSLAMPSLAELHAGLSDARARLDQFVAANRRQPPAAPPDSAAVELNPKREERTTTPCAKNDPKSPCAQAREHKSLGVASLLKATTSPTVDARIAAERLDVCRSCRAVDSGGERLFREIEALHFCGAPRAFAGGKIPSLKQLIKTYRDETVDGCGCELSDKVQYSAAECPLKLWSAVRI